MPTNNPKISAYVPPSVFDRFKQFQEERDLSMSQAAIVILSEYFGIEQTIKGTTEGTTVGGITLARIEAIELQLKDLLNRANQKETTNKLLFSEDKVNQKEITDKPLVLDTEIRVDNEVGASVDENIQEFDNSSLPLGLFSKLPEKIEIQGKLLVKRLSGVSASQLSSTKGEYKGDLEGFSKWLQEKDIDNIAWMPLGDRKGYTPVSELSSELKSRLLKWIADNSS